MSMICEVDIYPGAVSSESILSWRDNVDLTSVKIDIYAGAVAHELILCQRGNVDLASVKLIFTSE